MKLSMKCNGLNTCSFFFCMPLKQYLVKRYKATWTKTTGKKMTK